jgi:tetratricopeptide (TPR) repeat protein
MDCRRSLLLALGVLASCAGCLSKPSGPTSTLDPNGFNEKNWTFVRGKQKQNTDPYVAFGLYREQLASQKGISPAEEYGLREQALKAYQEALTVNPRDKSALVALAQLYNRRGDPDKALQTYQKAAKFHPKDGMVWFNFGLFHCQRKEWGAALDCLTKAADLNPDNRDYVNTLGFTLAKVGRLDEGASCLAKTMGKAEAHFNVARLLERENQVEMSKHHLRLALQLKPDHRPAGELLAQLETAGTAEPTHVNIGFQSPAPSLGLPQ